MAERDVIEKLEELLDPSKREPYFYLGNTKAHTRSFMIVGLFHPPKTSAPRPGVGAIAEEDAGNLEAPGFD